MIERTTETTSVPAKASLDDVGKKTSKTIPPERVAILDRDGTVIQALFKPGDDINELGRKIISGEINFENFDEETKSTIAMEAMSGIIGGKLTPDDWKKLPDSLRDRAFQEAESIEKRARSVFSFIQT